MKPCSGEYSELKGTALVCFTLAMRERRNFARVFFSCHENQAAVPAWQIIVGTSKSLATLGTNMTLLLNNCMGVRLRRKRAPHRVIAG